MTSGYRYNHLRLNRIFA